MSHPQKPLDLYLPEGGGLTLATATLLKEMHSVGKNSILNPGYLFGQVRSMRLCNNFRCLQVFLYLETNQALKKDQNTRTEHKKGFQKLMRIVIHKTFHCRR